MADEHGVTHALQQVSAAYSKIDEAKRLAEQTAVTVQGLLGQAMAQLQEAHTGMSRMLTPPDQPAPPNRAERRAAARRAPATKRPRAAVAG
jgi:hypothetical protein